MVWNLIFTKKWWTLRGLKSEPEMVQIICKICEGAALAAVEAVAGQARELIKICLLCRAYCRRVQNIIPKSRCSKELNK